MLKTIFAFIFVLFVNKNTLAQSAGTPLWMQDAILKTFKEIVQSSGIDEQIVVEVASLCGWTNSNKEICSLEKRVREFKTRLRDVYQLDELLIHGTPSTQWDVRRLVIGEALILPSFDGPESTMNKVARVFFERRTLLQTLSRTKVEIQKFASNPSPMASRIKIPRLQAAIFAASPIGEILTFEHFVTCNKNDSLCKLYKEEVRRLALASVKPHLKEIKNLLRRFEEGVSAASEERVRVIAKQLELAKKIQSLEASMTQSEILTALLEIQRIKAFDPSPYAANDLLFELQVLAELDYAKSFIGSVTAKKNSSDEAKKLREIVNPSYQDTVVAIDVGLKLLGLEIETYD